MPMPITRKDTTITARDSGGKVIRVHECRDVRRAVALEAKLAGDHAFAARWAQECEPKASVLMYHSQECTGRGAPRNAAFFYGSALHAMLTGEMEAWKMAG